MHKLLILFSLSLASASCDREEDGSIGENVEFHMLKSFETTQEGSLEIDETCIQLDPVVLIAYDELLSYDPEACSFKIEEDVFERLEYQSAFAVTVDGEIIYTGYFWSSISSRTVDWIVIDLLKTEIMDEYHLSVELGYPGLFEGMVIPDRRNDERILSVFHRDGKLTE